MNNHCEWCGNESGKTDIRGMCISCGGNLTDRRTWKSVLSKFEDNEWVDHSGSSYYLENMEQIFTPHEIRKMIFTEIETDV